MLAVGIFAQKDHLENFSQHSGAESLNSITSEGLKQYFWSTIGLFHGGGFYLLGVQLFACVCCILWSMVVTYVLIKESSTNTYCAYIVHIYYTKSFSLIY